MSVLNAYTIYGHKIHQWTGFYLFCVVSGFRSFRRPKFWDVVAIVGISIPVRVTGAKIHLPPHAKYMILWAVIEWLSVRLHRVHLHLDEYQLPFMGTVRTPTVASGHGYCLQTAHLESRRFDLCVRSPANLLSYGGGKGGNPTYPNPTTR